MSWNYRVILVEVDGCIFDKKQLSLSHGFDDLDPVARETLVNHIHIPGDDRQAVADRFIHSWAAQMRSRWPGRRFRILMQTAPSEVTISFHLARTGHPEWTGAGVEVIEVGPQPTNLTKGHG